jgi:site-specific DNA-methyltransferase (adenine-specific)
MEKMPEIDSQSVDMVLCDLPYGTTDCGWDSVLSLKPLWSAYSKVLKQGGAIVLFSQQPFTTTLISSNMDMFRYLWIWNKKRCGNFALAKFRPMIVHEEICVFGVSRDIINYYPIMEHSERKQRVNPDSTKSEVLLNAGFKRAKSSPDYEPWYRYPKNILTFDKDHALRLHPTQKPVSLLKYLIRTYTKEYNTVLDNCMGSGSTGVASLSLGRHFIGIEKDRKIFALAKDRIEAFERSMK